jgi:hypothetical protein
MTSPILSPHDSASSTSPSPSTLLTEYADLRWQKACLDAKLKEIESMAIEEALTLINDGNAVNQQRVCYRTETVEIVLKFQTTKPKPSDHPDLQTLNQWINEEAAKAQRNNAEAIADIRSQLAHLETQLNELMQTKDGKDYQQMYDALVAQLTQKKPLLAVTLK